MTLSADVINFAEMMEEGIRRLFHICSNTSDDYLERHQILDESRRLVFGLALNVLAKERNMLTKGQTPYADNLGTDPSASDAFGGFRSSFLGRSFAPSELSERLDSRSIKQCRDTLRELRRQLESTFALAEDSITLIGKAFEVLNNKIPSCDSLAGQLIAAGNTRRRDEGIFYTPLEIVRFLVKETLLPAIRKKKYPEEIFNLRIIDPAVGTGFFLIESLRLLNSQFADLFDEANMPAPEFKMRLASRCLCGVDLDPAAVDITRALIWIEVGEPTFPIAYLRKTIKCGDSLIGQVKGEPEQFVGKVRIDVGTNHKTSGMSNFRTSPLLWSTEFPEIFQGTNGKGEVDSGFDIVVSNPPWGIIKPNLREFYAHLDERVSFHQGQDLKLFLKREGPIGRWPSTEVMWNRYSNQVKTYASLLRESDMYHFQKIRVDHRTSGGDADLYKYFMERCYQLIHAEGRVGLVVPGSFQRSEGATGLRRLYLETGNFELLIEFLNKQNLFPIHSMFRFLLLVYQKSISTGVDRAVFGLTDTKDLQHISDGRIETSSIPLSYLKNVSGESMSIPNIDSVDRRELFSKLHRRFPPLRERLSNTWNVIFHRELDMTNDSKEFVTKADLVAAGCHASNGVWYSPNGEAYLPLVEGRMLHQFDFAAKAYESGQARTARWEPLSYNKKRIVPHYYVSESKVMKRVMNLTDRAAFRDVTGHANERTVLSAMVPRRACCGNKVPTCEFDVSGPAIHLLWTAVANSFVLDWIARRRISTSMNYFLWYQLPFPRIDPNSGIGYELVSLAAKLSGLGCNTYAASNDTESVDDFEMLRRRAQVRADIDAIIADVFELTPQELSIILEDFPLLDRYQPALKLNGGKRHFGGTESRSTITSDKVLLHYFHRKNMIPPDDVEEALGISIQGVRNLSTRIEQAEQLGAIAYVPSQMAKKFGRKRVV